MTEPAARLRYLAWFGVQISFFAVGVISVATHVGGQAALWAWKGWMSHEGRRLSAAV
jgi:hypothetical protein